MTRMLGFLRRCVHGVQRGQRREQQGHEAYQDTFGESIHQGKSPSHLDGKGCGSWHPGDSLAPLYSCDECGVAKHVRLPVQDLSQPLPVATPRHRVHKFPSQNQSPENS